MNVNGSTFTINQLGAPCTSSINPTSITIGEVAFAALTVAVSSPAGCSWTATPNANWLQITSGNSGSGDGTVTYSVSQFGGGSRNGTMTIAGQTFTVTQVNCSATLSPNKQDVPEEGGSFSVSVTTQLGCEWQAIESLNWVTVTSGSIGTGNGTVTFTVSSNTGKARSGNIAIAGKNLPIDQAGASK